MSATPSRDNRKANCRSCRERWAQSYLDGFCMSCARERGFDGTTRDIEALRQARQAERWRTVQVIHTPQPPIVRVDRGIELEVVWPRPVETQYVPWVPTVPDAATYDHD